MLVRLRCAFGIDVFGRDPVDSLGVVCLSGSVVISPGGWLLGVPFLGVGTGVIDCSVVVCGNEGEVV